MNKIYESSSKYTARTTYTNSTLSIMEDNKESWKSRSELAAGLRVHTHPRKREAASRLLRGPGVLGIFRELEKCEWIHLNGLLSSKEYGPGPQLSDRVCLPPDWGSTPCRVQCQQKCYSDISLSQLLVGFSPPV